MFLLMCLPKCSFKKILINKTLELYYFGYSLGSRDWTDCIEGKALTLHTIDHI